MLKNIFRLLGLFVVLFALPAPAADAVIQATPALWHVTGKAGEAWLFGSIHVLPPGIDWRTQPVMDALARADVFVFELPVSGESMTRMAGLVVSHGYLPPGESLRAKLSADEQADFDAALAAAGLKPEQVDRARPWLADLQITFAQLARSRYSMDNGVDAQLQRQFAGKEQRYLETVDQQFALLVPEDVALELDMFRSSLKDLAKPQEAIGELVQAWSAGDAAAIDELMNEGLDKFPDARKALLDDRNARWVPQIEAMLKEKHHFFITVGAGHLAGPGGVPALLRKAGYRVEGP
jgi:uncharacterized protein YbaP (TraB family)